VSCSSSLSIGEASFERVSDALARLAALPPPRPQPHLRHSRPLPPQRRPARPHRRAHRRRPRTRRARLLLPPPRPAAPSSSALRPPLQLQHRPQARLCRLRAQRPPRPRPPPPRQHRRRPASSTLLDRCRPSARRQQLRRRARLPTRRSTASSTATERTARATTPRRCVSLSLSRSRLRLARSPRAGKDADSLLHPQWATDHQGAGAWLQLTWSSPVTLNQVALFDRVNLNDFITNATLSFSDGSFVSTGSLNNAGVGVYVNFTARATTSLRFTVVSVSSTTSSAGLAELQAFNNPAAQIPATSRCVPLSCSRAALEPR